MAKRYKRWICKISWLARIVYGKKGRDLWREFYTREIQHQVKSYGVGLRVNAPCSMSPNTILGDYCNFNGISISGSGVCKIGDYFHSGDGCRILTENHNYEGNEIPYDSTYVAKDVKIGNFVWLGIHVIVLPGSEIGDGAIIQAGSVVHGKIPPYAIAGGNPAVVFKYRDKEHFEKLKKLKKFH
ncbi:MAG: acyltransferase [Alphaproteobacteria bacterium]|nr:acyltransferase [Alphaproteobacteria bacterium]